MKGRGSAPRSRPRRRIVEVAWLGPRRVGGWGGGEGRLAQSEDLAGPKVDRHVSDGQEHHLGGLPELLWDLDALAKGDGLDPRGSDVEVLLSCGASQLACAVRGHGGRNFCLPAGIRKTLPEGFALTRFLSPECVFSFLPAGIPSPTFPFQNLRGLVPPYIRDPEAKLYKGAGNVCCAAPQ